jgi:hypothetical protein
MHKPPAGQKRGRPKTKVQTSKALHQQKPTMADVIGEVAAKQKKAML